MTVWQAVKDPRAFPTLILVLEVCATVRYGFARNWWQCSYWFFASELTALCTFWAAPR